MGREHYFLQPHNYKPLVQLSLATYVDDVGVHEAGDPLVFAHHSGVLIVSAVAVAPAARLARFDALLPSVTQHVVQPDFPWTGSKVSVCLQQTPGLRKSNQPRPGSDTYVTVRLQLWELMAATYPDLF